MAGTWPTGCFVVARTPKSGPAAERGPGGEVRVGGGGGGGGRGRSRWAVYVTGARPSACFVVACAQRQPTAEEGARGRGLAASASRWVGRQRWAVYMAGARPTVRFVVARTPKAAGCGGGGARAEAVGRLRVGGWGGSGGRLTWRVLGRPPLSPLRAPKCGQLREGGRPAGTGCPASGPVGREVVDPSGQSRRVGPQLRPDPPLPSGPELTDPSCLIRRTTLAIHGAGAHGRAYRLAVG